MRHLKLTVIFRFHEDSSRYRTQLSINLEWKYFGEYSSDIYDSEISYLHMQGGDLAKLMIMRRFSLASQRTLPSLYMIHLGK
jgi:hypothetical protein